MPLISKIKALRRVSKQTQVEKFAAGEPAKAHGGIPGGRVSRHEFAPRLLEEAPGCTQRDNRCPSPLAECL